MLLPVLLAAISCPGSHAAGPAPRDHQAELAVEVADMLGGCAVADVDPTRPGNEIVLTAGSGDVLLAFRSEEGFGTEVVFHAPGEMIQVAAGDALPERPGAEIVVVGMEAGSEDPAGPGAAHVLWRDGEAWRSAQAFRSEALIHGAAIGAEGVYLVGYDRKVHLLAARGTEFVHVAAADLPGNGKTALAVPEGVVVACTDGSLVEARLEGNVLATSVIDHRSSGRARVGGERDRLVVADDDGVLSLITPAGRQELYRDQKKLRGAVLADLDTGSDGLEVATTGYAGRVLVLRAAEGSFAPSLLLTDRAGFHHAAAGELDGRPGAELVVCGMGGRVFVFSFGAP